MRSKIVKKMFLFVCSTVMLAAMVSCTGPKNEDLLNEPFSIEYSLTGGVAGFRDKAAIKSTGEFVYQVSEKVVAEGIIAKEDMDKIRKYAVLDGNFIDKKSSSKDTEIYPDKLFTNFTVSFMGKEGTSKKSNEIIKLIEQFREQYKK